MRESFIYWAIMGTCLVMGLLGIAVGADDIMRASQPHEYVGLLALNVVIVVIISGLVARLTMQYGYGIVGLAAFFTAVAFLGFWIGSGLPLSFLELLVCIVSACAFFLMFGFTRRVYMPKPYHPRVIEEPLFPGDFL